jgi:GT2 family glycosyltransferase
VVLNWNGKKFLERFLPYLQQSTYPGLRIWLADNGSTDDSVAFVRYKFPGIQIVINPTNEGFAQGYNSALKQIDSDFYVLLNSDVEVEPGWIEPMVAKMEQDKNIAACQPKILDWNRRTHFEYAGGAGGWMDRYGYPFCRGRVFDSIEEDRGQYDQSGPVFWASGAAMFIRAELYHQMGGFDPFFFAHQEEIDLCWRIQHAGYQVYACPESVVYHVGGGTLPQGSSRKIFLNFRNNLIMLWKNLGHAERCWKIPYRLALDLLSVAKNLLMGKWPYAGAVIKAHWAFFGWLAWHRKKSHYPVHKIKNLHGKFEGNVVWMHFLRGINSFSEILQTKK